MGELTLLHPWLLAGALGAALPVLIHLIGRRRAPVIRFAAFDFLVAVNKRLARRERLRQFLLLLLRTLAILALAFAVARPMQARQAVVGDIKRSLVLVIDASASMAYVHDGTRLLDNAKQLALESVSHLRPGDAVTLVIAGREVRAPFATPTLDTQAVRAAIEAIEEPAGVADLGADIDNGLSQVGDDGSAVSLVVVSDLSQNSFDALRPTQLDPPPEVRLIDAAQRENPIALSNVAIEAVRVDHSKEATTERRLVITVRNYGSQPVQGHTVELVIGDAVKQRGYVDVPARGSTEKTLTCVFDGPGVYDGAVRLAPGGGDGYHADDAASFVTHVVPGVRLLAINGDPRTTPYEDELFFIERALEAVPRGDPLIDLRIATIDELVDLPLTGFDAVILANVATLPDEMLSALRAFVREGGGLLFAVGDRVRFEGANARYGDLLPYPLRDLHRAYDPDAGTPPVGIGDMDWDHPILHGLGLPVEKSLRASRTASYFNLGVGAGLKARPVLRFDNGAPALIERREGAGRVMLLATSLDVDLTDLPLRSAFPPIMQRTARYLAGAVQGGSPGSIREGGTVIVPAPTGTRGLRVTSPSGKRREALLQEGGARRARFTDVTEQGVHRLEVLRTDWEPAPHLAFAVSPTIDESDFFPVSVERVSEALGGEDDGQAVSVFVGAGQHGDPFARRGWGSFLLVALALFFVSESLLASRG